MSRRQWPASRMRHRVTLQQPLSINDDAGGVERSWEDVADLWAEIEPLTSSEEISAGQLYSGRVLRLVLRAREDIDESKRLLHDGRIYDIRSMKDRRKESGTMEIIAVEAISG